MLGDAAEELAKIEEGSVDLCYIDPPFFTQSDWGDFDDRWESREAFVAAMREIAEGIERALRPGGSLYWHTDENSGHHLKVMLDGVFGEVQFRREIVWQGHSASGGKTNAANWVREHDTILFYAKQGPAVFHRLYVPHSAERKRRFDRTDEDGRRYQQYSYQAGKGRRLYLDESPGAAVGSVWRDFFATSDPDRTGYQTQKPAKLLARIIEASSNPGDLVLDPCFGSGTTLIAAEGLGRRWIGIDRNPRAHEVAMGRLAKTTAGLGL